MNPELDQPLWHNYYDGSRGFEHDHPGWYQLTLVSHMPGESMYNRHLAVVQWIYDTLDRPFRHCRWFYDAQAEQCHFRFRREADFLVAVLRWQG